MKTLNIYEIAEMQFLFVENKCVTVNMLSDATIRKEYHENVFLELGCKIIELSELTNEQLNDIKKNFSYCISDIKEFQD